MSITSAAPARRRGKGFVPPEPARVLTVPSLPGRVEEVIATAVKELKRKHAAEVDKAEKTIDDFGLTIEATQLRDRLHRSLRSDLQRLLLSTPGVTEKLFNDAIEAQLKEEEAEKHRDPVKDESVSAIGKGIEDASHSLEQSLREINESTQKFQESTKAIVETLDKVVNALEDSNPLPEGRGAEPPSEGGGATGKAKL